MSVLTVGSAAPDFTLPDAEGRPQSLSQALERGPVLLVFFKISCPTSQYTLPIVQRLWEALGEGSATIWAISQDSPEHTGMFNQEFGVHLPELFDAEEKSYPVSEAYRITNVPTLFLVEQDGSLALVSMGFHKEEMEEIARRLSDRAGSPVPDLFQGIEEVPLVIPGCSSKN